MRDYETVFIIHPDVDDAGIEKRIEAVTDVIKKGDGEVEGVYKWGRRKLAYQIRKVGEGFYTLIRFRSDPPVLKEIDRVLKLDEMILRHMTVRAIGEPMPPDSRGKRGRRSEARQARRKPEEKAEERSEEKAPEADTGEKVEQAADSAAVPGEGAGAEPAAQSIGTSAEESSAKPPETSPGEAAPSEPSS